MDFKSLEDYLGSSSIYGEQKTPEQILQEYGQIKTENVQTVTLENAMKKLYEPKPYVQNVVNQGINTFSQVNVNPEKPKWNIGDYFKDMGVGFVQSVNNIFMNLFTAPNNRAKTEKDVQTVVDKTPQWVKNIVSKKGEQIKKDPVAKLIAPEVVRTQTELEKLAQPESPFSYESAKKRDEYYSQITQERDYGMLLNSIKAGVTSIPTSLVARVPVVGWFMFGNISVRNSMENMQARISNGEKFSDSDLFLKVIGDAAIDVGTEMAFGAFKKIGASKTAGSILDSTRGFLDGILGKTVKKAVTETAETAVKSTVKGNYFIKQLLKSPVTETAEELSKRMAKQTIPTLAKGFASNFIEEGSEEFAGGILGGVLAKLTTDKDKLLFDIGNDKDPLISLVGLFEAFLGGGFGSGFSSVYANASTFSRTAKKSKELNKPIGQVTFADLTGYIEALSEDLKEEKNQAVVAESLNDFIERNVDETNINQFIGNGFKKNVTPMTGTTSSQSIPNTPQGSTTSLNEQPIISDTVEVKGQEKTANTLYHGTAQGIHFEKFDKSKANSGVGQNAIDQGDQIYLTETKSSAEFFSNLANQNADLKKGDLPTSKSTNVIEFTLKDNAKILTVTDMPRGEKSKAIIEQAKADGYDAIQFEDKGFATIEGSETVYNEFQKLGRYPKTTIVLNEDIVIASNPIKNKLESTPPSKSKANKTVEAKAEVKQKANKQPVVEAKKEILSENTSTGEVFKIGDKVYKNTNFKGGKETLESEVYNELKDSEVIAKGETVTLDGKQYIQTPYFERVLSIDTIKKEDREKYTDVVYRNFDRILLAVQELTNAGYNYSDPLQFGYKNGKLYLMDFSNVEKANPTMSKDHLFTENMDRVSNFLSLFGVDRYADIVNTSSKYKGLLEVYTLQDIKDGMTLMDKTETEIVTKLKNSGGEIIPYNMYFAKNVRDIGIKNIAQTDSIDKIKYVYSEIPLSEKDISDWELTKIYEGNAIKRSSKRVDTSKPVAKESLAEPVAKTETHKAEKVTTESVTAKINNKADAFKAIIDIKQESETVEKDSAKLENINLQIHALKEQINDMGDEEITLKERTYLSRILSIVTDSKPEDVASTIKSKLKVDDILYETISNKESYDRAMKEINDSDNPNRDARLLVEDLFKNKMIPHPFEVVVVNEYLNRLLKGMDDNIELSTEFASVSRMISIMGTEAGQAVQAFAMISESLPYKKAQKIIEYTEKQMDITGIEEQELRDKVKAREDEIKKLRKELADAVAKDVEKEIEQSDVEENEVPVKKGNKKPSESNPKKKDAEPIPLTLEQRLVKMLKSITVKTDGTKQVNKNQETQLLNALFRKAKEVIGTDIPKTEVDRYKILAEIVSNRKQYAEVWNGAKELAKNDGYFEESGEYEQYFQMMADPVMANRYMDQVIIANLKKMEVPFGQMAKEYFLKGDETTQGFIDMLKKQLAISSPTMTQIEYDYLETYVMNRFKNKMESKRQSMISNMQKKTNKKVETFKTEQQIMIEMLSDASFYNAFDMDEINTKVRETWAKKLGIPIVTSRMALDIQKTMMEISRSKDIETEDRLYMDMIHRIASQMTATSTEKIQAWLNTAMLLSPKTLVRNMGSNYANRGMAKIHDVYTRALEKAMNVPMELRIAGTKLVDMKEDSDIMRAVNERASDAHIQNLISNIDKITFMTVLQRYKKVFNSKVFEGMRKAGNNLLTSGTISDEGIFSKFKVEALGDKSPFRYHYKIQLANKMNALGYDNAKTKEAKDVIIEQAEEFAIKVATERVFRNRTIISNVIQKAIGAVYQAEEIRRLEKEGLQQGGAQGRLKLEEARKLRRQGKALQLVFKILQPFVITPASVTSTSYKYSPAALMVILAKDVALESAMGKIEYKGKKLGTGLTPEKKAILARTLGQALSGSTTTALLGFILGLLGLVTGSAPKDKKEKAQWDAMGKRAYSIYIPGIGSFSIDWLTPVSAPMLMGAQLAQLFSGGDTISDKLLGVTDSVIDSLMTNSIFDNRTLKLGAGDSWSTIAQNLFTNSFLQAVPSAWKNFNKSLDPYVRTTYSPDFITNLGMQFLTFVPFGTYFLDPKIDMWGNNVKQSNLPNVLGFAERVFMNMVSPFIRSKPLLDPTSKEVMRVYEATKEEKISAVPSVPSDSFTVNKVEYKLEGDDYVKYLKKIGELRKKNVDSAIKTQEYKDKTDKQKAMYLSKIYENAVQTIKNQYVMAHPQKK